MAFKLSSNALSPREKHHVIPVLSPVPSLSRAHSGFHGHPRGNRRAAVWKFVQTRTFLVISCCMGFYLLTSLHAVFERHTHTMRIMERGRIRENLLHDVVPLSGQELMKAVHASRPISRLQCGDWVDQYAQLHHTITTGRGPQRYTIMRSKKAFENGLADRISSSISILLYAILSGRAFQYDWEGDYPLWDFLRSDYIDWQYNGADLGNDTMLMDYVMDKGVPEYLSFFWEQDPSMIGEGKHSVVWYTDHGIIWKAFENPILRPKLDALGLEQETAFACLFDFLYRPTPDIIQLLESELSALLDPNVLKIGVQIRVGDWQLVSSTRYIVHPQQNPGLFRHYFECAKQIEDDNSLSGQKVVWFTVTDTAELRERLETLYPSRLLVALEATIEHMVKSSTRSIMGFKYAVGELWAFSLADYHIITRKSGFGKVGAMVRANGEGHIYTVDYPIQMFNLFGLGGPAIDNRKVVKLWEVPRSCRSDHADQLSKVCTDFTGI